MKPDLVLTGAGRLVTCAHGPGTGALGVIEDGALLAEAGRVVWVGPRAELPVEPDDVRAHLDAGGRAVLPGFVDPHTHLVFAGDRSEEFAARLAGTPYATGGVRTTVAATRQASEAHLAALARARMERFLDHGVTTVEAKSGYALEPDGEVRSVRIAGAVGAVPTFMGAHVVPAETDPDGYVEDVCERMIPAVRDLAEFCDVWCDEGAFTVEQSRRVLEAARAEGMGLKVHAEQMAASGGAALAAEMRATSVEHLEHASADDAIALAAARTVAVLLPGASLMTRAPFAPARMLIEAGVRVALSTDLNPGSSYTENLQLMVALACIHLDMSPEEAILGITRHAAAAIAREGRAGSLEPGAACDLVVLDAETELDLAYHYGVNLAHAVVKDGRVVRPRGAV